MKKKVIIYTDGSCNPNPGIGSWGFVKLDSDHETIIHEVAKVHDFETTNNRMEYTAFIEALKTCNETDEIEVFSDSLLLVRQAKGITRQVKSNLDLVNEIKKLTSKYKNINISWVKAHSSNYWNNYVDNMCIEELNKVLDS